MWQSILSTIGAKNCSSLLQESLLFIWFGSQRFSRIILLEREAPEHNVFHSQLTNQIIIHFEATSESRAKTEKKNAFSQKKNPTKIPESVGATERVARSSIHMPFRWWCSVCQRAKGQQHYHKVRSQKVPWLFSWIIISTEFRERHPISKRSCLWKQSHQCQEKSLFPISLLMQLQSKHSSSSSRSMDSQSLSSIWWTFRFTQTSRTSRQRNVTSNTGQSSVCTSESRNSSEISQDSLRSSSNNQNRNRRSSWSSFRSDRWNDDALDHWTCNVSIQQVSRKSPANFPGYPAKNVSFPWDISHSLAPTISRGRPPLLGVSRPKSLSSCSPFGTHLRDPALQTENFSRKIGRFSKTQRWIY